MAWATQWVMCSLMISLPRFFRAAFTAESWVSTSAQSSSFSIMDWTCFRCPMALASRFSWRFFSAGS